MADVGVCLQGRRKLFSIGPAGYTGPDLEICVREGGTPPAQQGGMGERCKLPEPQKPTLFANKLRKQKKNHGQEAFKIVSILFICVPAMPKKVTSYNRH